MDKIQHSPLALPLLFLILGIGVVNEIFIAALLLLVGVIIALGHSNKIKINKSVVPLFLKTCFLAMGFFMLGKCLNLFQEESTIVIKSKTEINAINLSFTEGIRFSKKGAWAIASANIQGKECGALVNMDSVHGLEIEKGDAFNVFNLSVYPLVKEGRLPNAYEKYLIRKGLSMKLYLHEKSKIIVLKNDNSAYDIYNYAHQKIIQSPLSSDAKALLLSLLIGDRGYIDRDVKDQFGVLGVSHILSVSGLHVGIIYLIIVFLFGIFLHKRGIVTLILTLTLIWFYCWMVGFEAAVLRSALMFSIHAIGKYFGQENNLFHSTTVSALIILILFPSFLYDIGFQLTYGAMLGIIFVLPIFQRWINIESKWKKSVVDLLLLSLAVQITLLPFLIYYFQYLSTYFMISNLMVIPLIAIIMYAGIVFLITPYFKVLIVGINYLVDGLYFICEEMYSWPFSVFIIQENNLLSLTAYSLAISSLVLYHFQKLNAYLWIMLTLLILLFF